MAYRAFGAGVLAGAAGYVSMRQIIQQRTADSMIRLEEMRHHLNPPIRRTTTTRNIRANVTEHEFYTYLREGWNSRVLKARAALLDLVKDEK